MAKCCMDMVKAELSIWNYQPNPNLTEAIIQCKSRKQLESIFNKTGPAQDYTIQFLTFRDYMQKYLQKQETKSFPISIANDEREFLCVELSSFYDFQVFNDPKWIKWYRNNYLF